MDNSWTYFNFFLIFALVPMFSLLVSFHFYFYYIMIIKIKYKAFHMLYFFIIFLTCTLTLFAFPEPHNIHPCLICILEIKIWLAFLFNHTCTKKILSFLMIQNSLYQIFFTKYILYNYFFLLKRQEVDQNCDKTYIISIVHQNHDKLVYIIILEICEVVGSALSAI